MRPVSFAGLLRMLQLVSEFPDGLRVHDLNTKVMERKIHLTRQNVVPSPTTLYHYRNTLLHLQALQRQGQRLLVNTDNPHVQLLLNQPSPIATMLPPPAREAFAFLVLHNEHCKKAFFDLFMPNTRDYTSQQFRSMGSSIIWKWCGNEQSRIVSLKQSETRPSFMLQSPVEIKSVLYGLRYWARDELQLIDEFFREDRGSILYPILSPKDQLSALEIVQYIISLRPKNKEWTTFSLQDLIVECCEHRQQPLVKLFAAIEWLLKNYSGYVVLIPTPRSLATLTARSQQREELELRGYFRDGQGRYISHIRLHGSIEDLSHVYTQQTLGA